MASAGVRARLGVRAVRRAVLAVLRGERARSAVLCVTFVSAARIRSLNRRALQQDRVTDVLAFPLIHRARVAGDVYVCPAAAGRAARALGIPVREELVRLVVHGTLHVLGHDHPLGPSRERSSMWRIQERYVRRLMRPDCP